MTVNGVDPDTRTRNITEMLRREVCERNLWEEDDDLGGGEVRSMLNKIETLMAAAPKKRRGRRAVAGGKRKWSNDQDWKSSMSETGPQDNWEFDRWDNQRKREPPASASGETPHSDEDRRLEL